jgi:hypothetical protein
MRRLVLIAMLSLSFTTCSDPAARRGPIRGTVRLDGQPLATGKIRFFAVTSGGIGLEADVQNGQYAVPMEQGPTAGKYRVEFVSHQKTGRKIPDPDGMAGDTKDETVNKIPFRYNRDSRLMIDYDPTVDQPFDFDLTTK